MGLLEYLPTRSETEHADAARDEAARVHKPTEACVDNCDNPYVCAEEWEAAQTSEPPPMDWDHLFEVTNMVDVEEETE